MCCCSGGKESAELRREQEQLENTLAELAKVAGRLSKEDQEKLSAVIADLGPLDCEEEGNSDVRPASVLHACDEAAYSRE